VAVWSPFYGKLALFQRKLSHFDINLSGGLGVVDLSTPDPDTLATNPVEVTGPQVEVVFGAGARFFVNDYLSLRMDYRQGLVPGADDDSGLLKPVEFTFGLAYMTGSSAGSPLSE
jgi:outer membrane beta-barrel protein